MLTFSACDILQDLSELNQPLTSHVLAAQKKIPFIDWEKPLNLKATKDCLLLLELCGRCTWISVCHLPMLSLKISPGYNDLVFYPQLLAWLQFLCHHASSPNIQSSTDKCVFCYHQLNVRGSSQLPTMLSELYSMI